MSARRKDVGTAAPVDDITAALGSRYGTTPTTPTPPQPRPAPTSGETTRRSWLLPTDLVAVFVAAADRVHHGSAGKIRKSDAQAAIIRVALDHLDEIGQYLSDDGRYQHQEPGEPAD